MPSQEELRVKSEDEKIQVALYRQEGVRNFQWMVIAFTVEKVRELMAVNVIKGELYTERY